MHQLDIIVSVSGSNLLQSFKEVCVVVVSLAALLCVWWF